MSHVARPLLSASCFQRIATAPRQQLRARRIQAAHTSNRFQIRSQHRTLTSSARRWKEDKDSNASEEAAVKLPEDVVAEARDADEVAKPTETVDTSVESQLEEAATKLEEMYIGEQTKPTQVQEEVMDSKQNSPADTAEAVESEAVQSSQTSSTVDGISGDSEQSESTDVSRRRKSETDVQMANIIGHGDSEVHQDLREYARLAAWELPLLHKLKKPFEPPTSKMPLRFRYTSYMGEEHSAAKKVVVEFKPADIHSLNEQQRIKLIKLVGTRYNPEKEMIKMSCESFETPAQNKRYLGDLVQKLLTEARDSKETFKDIPIDLRHHKQKAVYKFPEEWKITPPSRLVRGKGLPGRGTARRQAIQRLQEQGSLVDGVKVIQDALDSLPRQRLLTRPGQGQKVVLGARTKTKSTRSPARGGPAPSW